MIQIKNMIKRNESFKNINKIFLDIHDVSLIIFVKKLNK